MFKKVNRYDKPGGRNYFERSFLGALHCDHLWFRAPTILLFVKDGSVLVGLSQPNLECSQIVHLCVCVRT